LPKTTKQKSRLPRPPVIRTRPTLCQTSVSLPYQPPSASPALSFFSSQLSTASLALPFRTFHGSLFRHLTSMLEKTFARTSSYPEVAPVSRAFPSALRTKSRLSPPEVQKSELLLPPIVSTQSGRVPPLWPPSAPSPAHGFPPKTTKKTVQLSSTESATETNID